MVEKELREKRTANSKTFDLGKGRRRLVAHIGDVHYKDNYASPSEQWKDIDLTWEGNRITKAPYELTLDGNKCTILDKKSGKVSTIEPLDVKPARLKFEILPEFNTVRFRHILPSDKVPFEARFKVTGKIPFRARAFDDEGDLSLETTLKDGILTEKLSSIIGKGTGKVRPAKGNIRVDPTWQVGTGTDDCRRQLTPSAWSLTEARFQVGSNHATVGRIGSGARFQNITVPKETTIDAAYLTLRASVSTNVAGTSTYSRISAEDVDDAPTFADDSAAFDTRFANHTTARIDWDYPTLSLWTLDTDYNSPEIKTVIQEIVDRGGWASGQDIVIFWEDFDDRSHHSFWQHRQAYSREGSAIYAPKLVVTYTPPPPVAPTVTTQAVTDIGVTTATGNGTITAIGSENCTKRGVCWNTTGNPTVADSKSEEVGSFGTGAFTRPMTGLLASTHYYVRAYAYNSGGYGYGSQVEFDTLPPPPAAPTNVQATDGTHTDKVVITWTLSAGATGYQVYRDGAPLGWLGDVATYNDLGSDAPSITPGSSVASDGAFTDKVALSLSGIGTNNGTTHTYKVRARNAGGESPDSATDTGYRAPGPLTYQWQRSAADSDAGYSDISGATTASYDDTGAPVDGSGRYYRCRLNAAGAAQQYSASDRGYRLWEPPTPPVTTEYQRRITMLKKSDGSYEPWISDDEGRGQTYDPKVGSLISYEGTTTANGEGSGLTLIDSVLEAKPDYNGNLVIITSGFYAGQARDINGVTTGGTVTPASAFGGQIVSGVTFVIVGIRTVPAEVAALAAALGNPTADMSAVTQSEAASLAAYEKNFRSHSRMHNQGRICLVVPKLANLASDLPNTAIKAELDKIGTVSVLDQEGVDGGQEDWDVYNLVVVGSNDYAAFVMVNIDDLISFHGPIMVCNADVAEHLLMGTEAAQSDSDNNEYCETIANRVMQLVFGSIGEKVLFDSAQRSDRLDMSAAALTAQVLMVDATGEGPGLTVVGWLPAESVDAESYELNDGSALPSGRLFAGCFVHADRLTDLGTLLLRRLARNLAQAHLHPTTVNVKRAYQENIPDTDFALAAIDNALGANPPNADTANSIVDLDQKNGRTYVLRSLWVNVTSFGTAGTKLTFGLWVLLNEVVIQVDTVDVATLGIQNLADIFGLQEVHANGIWVTVLTDSGSANAACSGTFNYAEAKK